MKEFEKIIKVILSYKYTPKKKKKTIKSKKKEKAISKYKKKNLGSFS